MRFPLLTVFAASLVATGRSQEISDVFRVVRLVVVELFHTWEALAPKGVGESMPEVPFLGREMQLMDRLADITRNVRTVDKRVKEASRDFLAMVHGDLLSDVKLEMRLTVLLENIAGIEVMDHSLQEYLKREIDLKSIESEYNKSTGVQKTGRALESYTLEDFARSIVSHASYSVRSMSDNINRMIREKSAVSQLLNRQGIFWLILNQTETNSHLCNIQQSPQQLLFNLYNALQITQLKAYTMMQFSWMLLRLYNKGNFTSESQMMREHYISRLEDQSEEMKQVMSVAKRELWKCDPKRHIEGQTYTEITKLLQGYIVNEVDLNDQSSCREDCGYYQHTRQHGCYKDGYCSKQRPCRGKIIGCKYVDSDMWICPADSSSSRRYDWIEYENGRSLGLKKGCNRAITKVDSWWRWLFWHCSYCMCLCDDSEASDTDRFFNLHPVISDMTENMVITGVKFIKVNRVIHVQIQQGKMLPKGSIDESSVMWKPVDSYNIKSKGIKEGQDYHTLSWQQRAMDLDDLVAPPDYVLTGIRFRKLGTHLNLEIQASKFNFTTGELIQAGEKKRWIGNDNTDGALNKPRHRLPLDDSDVPTRVTSFSQIDSKHDQFFEFTNSDVDGDAAQSTIPYIDIQEVKSEPAIPLSGAGVYHKGQRYYGGFVGLKIFTLDYTPYIESNFPEINEMRRAASLPIPERLVERDRKEEQGENFVYDSSHKLQVMSLLYLAFLTVAVSRLSQYMF